MKFVIVFFTLVAVGMAAPSKTLRQDFKDIIDVLPVEQIRAVARRHLDNDPEFQKVVAYLQSDEWDKLVNRAANNRSWQNFKAYLMDAGVNIDRVIESVHHLIARATPQGGGSTRAVRDFIDEALALIEKENLANIIMDKMSNSEDFQVFFQKVSSDKSRALVEQARAIPEVQRIAQKLRGMNLDIDKVINVVYRILKWE